ncbi:MAG: glycoside hydrolase family 3 N-terminal domain-containing protein [Actinomycetota bacterium]
MGRTLGVHRPERTVRSAWTTVAVLCTGAVAVACVGTTGGQVQVTTTTTAPESTTTTPVDCAQMLPPEAQAAQMIWAVVDSADQATEVLADGTIGGIVLDGEQSSDVADEITEATTDAPIRVSVAISEEGGGVQPLANAVDGLPGAPSQAQGTPTEAATTMAEHADQVADLGVNVLFAPVADAGSGGGMGGRTYSSEAAEVTPYIDAVVPALVETNLTPVVKHWPGLGGADQNPVAGTATVASLDELRTTDLVPFQAAIDAGAPAVLVANVEVPGLTEADQPATISEAAITGELREAQGFDGLVIADDLSQQAVANVTTQDQAAELAIGAGVDVVVVSGSDAVADTTRRLTDAIVSNRLDRSRVESAVRRALTVKGITGECLDQVSAYNAILRNNSTTTTLADGSDGSDRSTTTDGSGSSTTVEDSTDTVPEGTSRSDSISTGPPTTLNRKSSTTTSTKRAANSG